MTIQTNTIEYRQDGTVFEGFLAWDDANTRPRPAVAIAHAWQGRDQFECNRAIALAEMGYVAMAIDIYGKGVLGQSVEENIALMTPLLENREQLQARATAAINCLKSQPQVNEHQVAAIGYCFGGLTVLDMARSNAGVVGVVSLHGLFTAPGNTAENTISAKVLCLHGYDDPMVPPQSIIDLGTELSAATADWQIHAYGGTQHAFTFPEANDPAMGAMYNPVAEKRSWQSVQNFLAELF